jgi:hypothetical protein
MIMFMIDARKGSITTTFVVGCLDRQAVIVEALQRGGFKIERTYAGTIPPKRTEEERNRATAILGTLFGR